MSAKDLLGNPKIASGVSAMTTGTGLGTFLDMIPNDIGKLATLVGIALSLVLMYTHWRKGRIEYRKTQLEIKILLEREAERTEIARLRERRGLQDQTVVSLQQQPPTD